MCFIHLVLIVFIYCSRLDIKPLQLLFLDIKTLNFFSSYHTSPFPSLSASANFVVAPIISGPTLVMRCRHGKFTVWGPVDSLMPNSSIRGTLRLIKKSSVSRVIGAAPVKQNLHRSNPSNPRTFLNTSALASPKLLGAEPLKKTKKLGDVEDVPMDNKSNLW